MRGADIIAPIPDTGRSKTNILHHLHFSSGRLSPDIVYEPLVWNQMRDTGLVTRNNPQSRDDWLWEVLGSNPNIS